MSKDDLLSQQEIDALLNVALDDEDGPASSGTPRIRPFDPATQHRVIRERLPALDIINAQFAGHFRRSLSTLLRRSADIRVDSVHYQSYGEFARHVPAPTSINLMAMKPLHGSSLMVFPPELVFMMVENLFGGDGRFLTPSEGREFTHTEQRIIMRILNLAMDAYQEAWQSVYPLNISYLRSETQARFAGITQLPDDIVVNTTFHLEVGNLASDFQICIPYAMIEPLRDTLGNLKTEHNSAEDRAWTQRLAGEIKHSEVELVANFVSLPTRIAQVIALKVGDVLPMELPDTVVASVDGVPVLECEFGSQHELRALRVIRIIEHISTSPISSGSFIKGELPKAKAKDSHHD